jgi:hypothetical protein
MKMIDNVMEDIWATKDEISAECGYSPVKLAEILRKQQILSKTKIVDYHNRTKQSTHTK